MPTLNTGNMHPSTPTARPKPEAQSTGMMGTPIQPAPVSKPAASKGKGVAVAASPVAAAAVNAAKPTNRGGRTPDSDALIWTRDRRDALLVARINGADTASALATALRDHPAFADVKDLVTSVRVSSKVRALRDQLKASGKARAAEKLALRHGGGARDLDEIEAMLLAEDDGSVLVEDDDDNDDEVIVE